MLYSLIKSLFIVVSMLLSMEVSYLESSKGRLHYYGQGYMQ
ncbi:hypothetical protein [Clostridium gasigenes]|nr:hypothetical protein [Clostridium gasigenes]